MNHALITQKEYSSIKTMYILAIFFCIISFLEPLGMSIPLFQYPPGNLVPYIIQSCALYLLLYWPSFFILFVIFKSKSEKRPLLIFFGLLFYAIYPVITNLVNEIIYVQNTLAIQSQGTQMNLSDLSIQTFLIKNIWFYFKTSIYIAFAFVFYHKSKGREIKNAMVNIILLMFVYLASRFIFTYVWVLAIQIPENAITVWLFFGIVLVLFGCIFYWQCKPKYNRFVPVLNSVFILLIAIYTVIVYFSYSQDVFSGIISFLFDLLPFYLMYLVYKSISDYSFYNFFIESSPKEIIRAKQYAPTNDSVWSQFVILMRRLLWKNK